MATECLAQTAPPRRFVFNVDHCPANTLYIYGFLLLLLSSCIGSANAQQIQTEVYENDTKYVCSSMDIRNSLEKFKMLENCTVIEGFLQVLLFDNINHTDLSNIQFPKLTEITDYLLMYRVNGLHSVGQLFPNLALIRGQNLFLNNAALTVFEMSSLQEIGLHSLTEISQGVVHIDKNPALCFVHTINWDPIIREKNGSFIKSLKPENECPVCPSRVVNENSDTNENNSIISSCHIAPRTNPDDSGKDKYLCWNKHHCQKICLNNCTGVCNDKGQCCSEACVTCSNDDPNLCIVCKHLSMGDGKLKRCSLNCPPGYLRFLERRCITREECVNKDKPVELEPTIKTDKPYKVFNNSCLLNCPNNYMADDDNHECKPCGGRCQKECKGINIDSIAVAKTLKGCTHIKGSLEIQIRGGAKVVSGLEENLSMIEEISEYLKVVRSFSLVSLNFFKSLKRIRGNITDSKYVFIVLDNQNLQELWSDNRTLKIDNKHGKLFFHFNPKLCYSKIQALRERANLPEPTALEVARNSNGDKIACNVKNLEVNITQIKDKTVVLEWKKFVMDDMRKLLAYTVYCIEAPYDNITEYDRRDACGLDDWHVYDVTYQEHEEIINSILPNLKPFTQYAFYVKTYTVASEPEGAKSELQYFTTLPSTPSQPTHVRITSNSSDSLTVVWGPPNQPNGKITHYKVYGLSREHAYPYSKERNYCKDPPTLSVTPETKTSKPTVAPKTNNETCTCDEQENKRIQIDESEELQRIKFEDELHNQVYKKREPKDQRRKRQTDDIDGLYSDKVTKLENDTDSIKGTWKSFAFPVYGGKTEFYINKLHHYTSYEIHVQVCREKGGDPNVDECSQTSPQTLRTLQKGDADNVNRIQVTNNSLDTVMVSWEQPEDPNGVILTYHIEYQRVDVDPERMTHSSLSCLNVKNATNRTIYYTINKLSPGNYSLRVLATSSAKNGDYSPYVYFYIEEQSPNTILIVFIIILVSLVIMAFGGWMYRRCLMQEEAKNRINLSINPEYIPSVYVPDEWEVPRDKIELIRELGQGSFGMVWEGMARNIKGKSEMKCAVKTVNEHATNRERLEFLNEASVMKAFDTTHVVRLLGVVSQGQPTLVIMELMANGDLKSYLRSHRPDVENYNPTLKSPPTLRQIKLWSHAVRSDSG